MIESLHVTSDQDKQNEEVALLHPTIWALVRGSCISKDGAPDCSMQPSKTGVLNELEPSDVSHTSRCSEGEEP